MERLQNFANKEQQSLFNAIKSKNIAESEIKNATQIKLQNFVEFIESFTAKAFIADAFEFAKELAFASGIIAELTKDVSSIENRSRYENIESLMNGIKEFCDSEKANNSQSDFTVTISEYLDNVALITDADNEKEEDRNKVALMTAHQAKGLEYDYVYIVGMEENLFPSNIDNLSLDSLEEERRLFYVALTRAKVKANISFALSRYRWGKTENHKISRVVGEIDDSYLEIKLKKQNITDKTLNEYSDKDFDGKIARPISNVTTVIKRPTLNQHKPSESFTPSDSWDCNVKLIYCHLVHVSW